MAPLAFFVAALLLPETKVRIEPVNADSKEQVAYRTIQRPGLIVEVDPRVDPVPALQDRLELLSWLLGPGEGAPKELAELPTRTRAAMERTLQGLGLPLASGAVSVHMGREIHLEGAGKTIRIPDHGVLEGQGKRHAELLKHRAQAVPEEERAKPSPAVQPSPLSFRVLGTEGWNVWSKSVADAGMAFRDSYEEAQEKLRQMQERFAQDKLERLPLSPGDRLDRMGPEWVERCLESVQAGHRALGFSSANEARRFVLGAQVKRVATPVMLSWAVAKGNPNDPDRIISIVLVP